MTAGERSALRVRTEPLGGGPLAAAAIAGTAPVSSWYALRPRDPAAWRARADEVRIAAPSDWHDALLPAMEPTGAAARRLRRVASEGGVLVTTGQQPGLFGGPLFTWGKAISALALADSLEQETGIAAAPLFWAATDDADFLEASSTVIAVPGGTETLEARFDADGQRPLAQVPVGDVSALLGRLERGAGAAVHAEVLALARRMYLPDATVGGAFVGLLRAILAPLGIAVLDASHPAVRAAARPWLRRALEQCDAIDAALRGRVRAITAAGLEPQVPHVEGLTLVFSETTKGRQRIPLDAARELARRAPAGTLAPNVLLRPVVERAILPTVAYLAGPAEIAYFAQSTAVAEALGLPAPLAVPRWSGTIVEPHVQRILARHRLTVEELRDPHAVETRLADGELPEAARAALESLRRAIDVETEAMGAPAADEAPVVPPRVLEGHRRELRRRVDRLERRIRAAAKRRLDSTLYDIATARGALYPDGKRQERALNLLPLLARHGPVLLERIRDAAREHATAIVGARMALAEERQR